LIVPLTFVILITTTQVQGQVCKDPYNNALNFYRGGQYENINTYLNGCLEDIKNINNHNYYKGNGINILFKVYKICIQSYKNLDLGNLAERRIIELISYLNWARADVEKKLNETPLTAIE
jgi:hypothetical protein